MRVLQELERSSGFEGLGSMHWPELPDGVRELAGRLAESVEGNRRLQGLPPSVQDEEALLETVTALIDRVVEAPAQFGIQPMTQERLRTDPGFRQAVAEATRVRSSRLWPLSRLIFMLPGVEEIHCFRHDCWVVTGGGRKSVLRNSGNPFSSDEEVIAFFRDRVLGLVGVVGATQLNDGAPIAEATVGGLLRLIVAVKPAISGETRVQATIRTSAAAGVRGLEEYVRQGVMSPGCARFLEACVASRANLLVAGGTATGKTTLMRVLAGLIPDQETIVVIEDSAELHLESDRGDGPIDPASGRRASRPWVPLCVNLCTVPAVLRQDTGLTMRELVRSALRFRPDRILLGEARGAEMADVCTAMSTGHDGSMTTIHADSAFLAVDRAANYVMESPRYANSGNSYELAKRAVHNALDVVVHLTHGPAGSRRVSGVVALGAALDHVIEVYGKGPDGTLRRTCHFAGDLPARLNSRLGAALPGGQIPE